MSTIIKYGSSGAWLTYNGNVLNGNALTIPANTMRFRFTSAQTQSSLSGVGSSGTWAKVSDYVWDYTYTGGSWGREFYYPYESELLPSCDVVGSNISSNDDMYGLFYGQENIQTIYLNTAHGLTSAFSGCTSLTSVRFDSYNGMFGGTLNTVQSFEVGTWTGMQTDQLIAPACTYFHVGEYLGSTAYPQMLSHIGSAQTPCTVIIDSMPNATYITEIAQGGTGLGTVYLGNTRSIIDARNAFEGCSSLTQVHIADMSHVVSTRYMFDGCTSLQTCPAFDLSSCSNMEHMFVNCTSLTSCPEFTVNYELLGQSGEAAVRSMYSGCTSLTSGAFDWYYSLSGDTSAYYNVYHHAPPEPTYSFPYNPSSITLMFASASSTETGWPYISITWK